MEKVHRIIGPTPLISTRARQRALSPTDPPHTLGVSARQRESDHAADVVAEDVHWFCDGEGVEQGEHVGCHSGFAEVCVGGRGAAGAAVVGGDAAVACLGEEGEDVPELVEGLREAVEEEDGGF